MPSYKLTYFTTRGFAEISRLIFAQAGVEFEDIRVLTADWPEIKPTTPYGQAPVLEEDGWKLGQSTTIARYLAKKFNLAGKTPKEEALADSVIDAFGDLQTTFSKMAFGKDDAAKDEAKNNLVKQLATLEGYLTKQNGGDGYFVGDDVTWADLKAAYLISTVKEEKPDVLKDCTKLLAHCDRIEALPNIKAWLEKRPVQTSLKPK